MERDYKPSSQLEVYDSARRNYRENQRVIQKNRGKKDPFFLRVLGRQLYKHGQIEAAQRIAPFETDKIRYEDSLREFFDAEDEFKKNQQIPTPNPLPTTNPNTLNLTNAELQLKTPAITNPTEAAISIAADTNTRNLNREKVLAGSEEEIIDWREWNVWQEYDNKPRIESNELQIQTVEEFEEPFQYFDVNLKSVKRTKDSPTGYETKPQNNELLDKFVIESAKRVGKDGWRYTLIDLQNMMQHIINNPLVGSHIKKMRGASIKTEYKTYNLFRSDPRKIPHEKFYNPNSKSLRILYFLESETIVFHEILTHEEMTKKYGTRKRD